MSKSSSGKRFGQKYKSFLVAQILLKYTDENNPISVAEIIEHLNDYDIEAEYHSVVRDIKDLEELLNIEDEFSEDFVYERAKLGYTITSGFRDRNRVFSITSRPYEFEDIQLLSQCVNSAKFITTNKARELNEIIGSLCSQYQSEVLQNDPYLVGRTKTSNNKVIYLINDINEAIKTKSMISFNYFKYELKNNKIQKKNTTYKPISVSPFKLIINDGNYYLLAYNAKYEQIRTYRVDRIDNLSILNVSREGMDEFAKLNMNTYTQEVFGMFSGEKRRVHLRFENKLLDAVIERFGKSGSVSYSRYDEDHFDVSVDVEISDQFLSWVCAFRKQCKIIAPIEVVENMRIYLEEIKKLY